MEIATYFDTPPRAAYQRDQALTTEGLRTATATGPLTLASVASHASQVSSANGFTPDSNVYNFDPNDDEQPRVVTYNFALDQRLPGHMLLELAHVGKRSDKLMNDGSTQNTTLGADLTAAKRFKVTDGSSFQLRVATFHFINHANSTFTSVEQRQRHRDGSTSRLPAASTRHSRMLGSAIRRRA